VSRRSILPLVGAAVLAGPVTASEPPPGTLIVANMIGNTVWMIDVASGERRHTFDCHNDPHEVAVTSDGRLAAITNYGGQAAAGNRIQIADVATGEVLRDLAIDGYERLHGAAFLPGDSLLVLTSERTGELLVVSATDGSLRRTMPTGGRAPHMLAPGGPWVYAANIVDGSVARIDPTGETETRTWPVNATRTEGVAATPDGAEGWTGSMESGVIVGVNGETGEEVARVEGLVVPYRLAVTADGATVVATDPGSGRLGLVDRRTAALATVDVNAAAREAGLFTDPEAPEDASPQGFILSPDGRWAFVTLKAIGRIAVVDLAGREVVRFIETGAGPDGVAYSPVAART